MRRIRPVGSGCNDKRAAWALAGVAPELVAALGVDAAGDAAAAPLVAELIAPRGEVTLIGA